MLHNTHFNNSHKDLTKIFARYRVQLAYLFGSQSSGKTTKFSDIDIAVLFKHGLSAETSGKAQCRLIIDLMRYFNRNDVNVVVLNFAPPLLRFEVINPQYLLYAKSERERIRFETRTIQHYLDTRYLREFHYRYFSQRYQ